MVGFKPNMILTFLYKSMFFEFFGAYLEGGMIGSTKNCAYISYYKMQRMTKIIQKLDPCGHSAGLCPYIHLQI